MFPEAQQQLCVYHINANVRKHIYRKWKGPGANDIDDDTDESDNELSRLTEADFDAARRAEDRADRVVPAASRETPEITPDGIFEAWQRVIYAPTEDDFKAAWQAMINAFDTSQSPILQYIIKQ